MSKTEYKPDQLLGHADEADGIDEYDNKLPTWWVWLFYFTIAAGVFVFFDWHVVSPKSLAGLYDEQVAIADELYDELLPVDVELSPEAIAAGEALYMTNCVACHAEDGTGGVGANLVDADWIHGGTPDEINHTVFYGVDGAGMAPWAAVLQPEGVAQVSAYVYSLTNEIE